MVLVSLDDDHRFRTWFEGCKRVLIGEKPVPTAEKGLAAPAPPVDDAHARHCLRVLPTLYEIQWMKKLSDFWTPEEQRALYAKSQQLTRGEERD